MNSDADDKNSNTRQPQSSQVSLDAYLPRNNRETKDEDYKLTSDDVEPAREETSYVRSERLQPEKTCQTCSSELRKPLTIELLARLVSTVAPAYALNQERKPNELNT